MGIFKVLFFGNEKNRRKNKILDLRPKQFVFRITWKNVPIFLKKHVGLAGVFLLLITVGFFAARPFFIKASVATFYPTNCLGGWENIHNAEGEPQISSNDASALFNEQNSAYLNNRISQVYCGNFSGTLPQDTEPKKIILHLSWDVGKKAVVTETVATGSATSTSTSTDTVYIDLNEDFSSSAQNAGNPLLNSSSTNSTSTSETSAPVPELPSTLSPTIEQTPAPSELPVVTPVPAETPAPVETPVAPAETSAVPAETPDVPAPQDNTSAQSPTEAPASESSASPISFINFLIPKVYADNFANETTTISEIATTAEATATISEMSTTTSPAPAPVEDPVFTILYTLDGKTWNSLGSVTREEIGNKDFEIPVDNIQNQTDLSNIQINIQSATTFDQDLTIYLDGMSLAVQYEDSVRLITQKETDTNMGKLVTISAPNEDPDNPIVDVLASTTIPKIFKVGEENKIHIKWKNNGNQNVSFRAFDTDVDSYLDYVEWTVPHLSEQTFEIIFISKAFQLDSNQNIIADIYDQVQAQDGNYASLTDGQYVRVTFNEVLDKTKDNTIYAKPTDPESTSTIEVYPAYTDEDGNITEGPLVATFQNIDHEDTYKVLLTDLQTPTNLFDLKIIGNVGIDFIVDPVPVDTYWVGNGGVWSDATNHWAITSNGVPGVGNLPGATSNVHFDSSSGTGTVTIDSASVSVANFDDSSATIAISTGSNGITVAGDLTVAGTLSGATAVTLSGTSHNILGTGTISAPVVLGATFTANVSSGSLTISGNISGENYGITKTGAGTLTLSGVNNTYTGATTVSEGILLGGTLNVFGGATSTSAMVMDGGTLDMGGFSQVFGSLTGSGTVTTGTANSTILTIGYDNTSPAAYSGIIQDGTGFVALTKVGTGTLNLSGANTYTGATTINDAGTITYSGSSGAAASSSSFTVNYGGTLTLDNVSTNNTNRIGAVLITLDGGGFTFYGTNVGSTNATETFGTLILSGGQSTVTAYSGSGGQTVLTFGSINRVAGATVLFRGTNLGANEGAGNANIKFTTAPTLVGGGGVAGSKIISILPYATGDTSPTESGFGFVTNNVDGGGNDNGIRPLVLATEYYNSATPVTDATLNVRLTATYSPGAVRSWNSLLIDGAAAVTYTMTSSKSTPTLTINSGAIFSSGAAANTIAGTAVFTLLVPAAPNNEFNISTKQNLTVTAGIPDTNTPSVTKSGAGTMTFSSVVKAYSGATTINQGTLTYGIANALAAGAVAVNGGTLNMAALADTVGAVTLTNGGTITGTTGVLTATSYTVESGTISAIIAGAVTLTKNTTGTLTITKACTYSGATTINAGELVFSGTGTAVGSTAFTVNYGGTLTLDNVSTNNTNRIGAYPITLNGGSFNFKGTNVATTNAAETVGALTIGAGSNIVTVSPGTGGSATMTFASFSRTTGATVLFRGTNFGNAAGANVSTLVFTGAPTMTGQGSNTAGTATVWVIKGAFGDGSLTGSGTDMVTYQSSKLRLLTANEYNTTDLDTSNTNVKLSSGVAPTANTSINSLIVDSGGTMDSSSYTTTIYSGNVLGINGGGANSSTVLDFGANEGIIRSAGAFSISSQITGTGGITTTGSGTLTVSSNNTPTGTLTVTEGVYNQTGNLAITGDYSQTGGMFTGANPVDITFSVTNSFSITKGIFNRYTGSGTLSDPYMVRDAYDLQAIQSNSLTAYYKLYSSITLAVSSWNSGTGFVPIGNPPNIFTGTFDGDNKTISNLYIHLTLSGYNALFGQISDGSLIENLGLIDVDIAGGGPAIPGSPTAALVGKQETTYGDSTIINCYSTGSVTGTSASKMGGLIGNSGASLSGNVYITKSYTTATVTSTGSNWNVGGFVGNLAISDSGNVTVTNSYANGDVTGYASVGGFLGSFYVVPGAVGTLSVIGSYATGNVNGGAGGGNLGGFLGFNDNSGNSTNIYITNSYATGVIGATTALGVAGGLVGNAQIMTIQNSYATGEVHGLASVGGLVGVLFAGGTIKNSYATGKVYGNSAVRDVGPMTGSDLGQTNSYWVTAATNVGVGGVNIYGATTTVAALKLTGHAAYAGTPIWDFTNGTGTWNIITTQTYPHLQAITAGDMTLSGDGTLYGNLITDNFAVASGTLDMSTNTNTLQILKTLTVSGGTITATNGNINADGAVVISSGTLTAPTSGQTFTVAGNWTNSGGTFNPGTGTVTFNGPSAQSISSDNTWYGLSITGTTARTVSFESGKTQTIADNGLLTFQGALGSLLSLVPITPSSAWKLAVSTTGVTQNITYTSPSYSDASGIVNFDKTVNASGTGNVDGNYNTNWSFGGGSVSCSVTPSSTSFGTLDTGGVNTSSVVASTTITCSFSGGCTLFVQDSGDGSSPGLYAGSATGTPLIASATATLSPGTEGYGIQAATTTVGSGAVLTLSSTYFKSGDAVGGLTTAATVIANSTSAVTGREVVVTHKATISGTTLSGSYSDTITYSCVGN